MIVYLHGFNSTPQSRKACQLGSAMADAGMGHLFRCPALPYRPALAIELVERELAAHKGEPVTLVGSSLGGFYAIHLAEKHDLRAVLLNPAIYPARDLARYLGLQENIYSGERYELTEQHIRELEALNVTKIHPSRYLLIVETGDEVLDYREAVERLRGARQIVIDGGDHSLQSFTQHLKLIFEFAGL